jgi:hypothetical protein
MQLSEIIHEQKFGILAAAICLIPCRLLAVDEVRQLSAEAKPTEMPLSSKTE